jgi:hypothetical protein
MNNEILNGEKDFFVMGVTTYPGVDDAMTEFRRLVEHKCWTVASRRLDELNQTCGMHWTVKHLNNYLQKTDEDHFIGKQMEVKGFGGIYFCLRISRKESNGPVGATVFLYRTRRDLAIDLWDRAGTSASVTWKGRNNLGFSRPLPQDKIPDFEDYLDQAVTDFLAFINDGGGLHKYLS